MSSELIKFEKGGAREEEMTFAQAGAFIRTALDLGKRQVIPADRALAMAIGVAAQFELLLRQKDIIGDWGGPRGQKWTGYFTWENIPGWRWRMKTSKSKYRAAAEFDLSSYSLLLPLLAGCTSRSACRRHRQGRAWPPGARAQLPKMVSADRASRGHPGRGVEHG